MKAALQNTISIIIYLGAMALGICEIALAENSHRTFIGGVLIAYGAFSLLFFLLELRGKKG